jgi:hypothetical protein
MLFFVIGLPGRFAEWCEAATVRLVQHAFGPAERISADTLEEITENLLRSGATHGVVASRDPGFRIRRALVEAGRPFVVVPNDPWASLAHLVARDGLAMAAATRQVASSCASLISFGAAPGSLVLDARRDGIDRLSVAAAIAHHLQLEVSDGDIADIVNSLDEGSDIMDPSDTAAWWDGLDPGERAIASGALGPYLEHSPGRGLGPITWAPELFFIGDRPSVHVTGGVDITGRARCLLRGPHIMLPPAIWSFSVAVDVSPEVAEHTILIEAAAGGGVSRAVLRPARAGTVEADLILRLDELPDRRVELLLSTQRPAFAGHVTLVRVTLTPQPTTPIDAPAEASADDPRTAAP